MQLETKVGPIQVADGTFNFARSGRTGETIVGDLHSRFYEQAIRGNLFSAGMTLTSIANVTFTTATLGATGTPIVGVWNPPNSGKNVAILQVRLQIITTTLGARTGPGGFVWATGVNQSGISTGITPLNRLSLANSGSVAKGFANTALTGLSANLTVQEAAGVGGGPMPVSGTDVLGVVPYNAPYVDNIDGAIIVAPGSVLALLCTTTPVGISATSSILWEEVTA
jgi:hypothetical protein